MAAKLWLVMLDDIKHKYDLAIIPFSLTQKLAKTPKAKVDTFLRSVVVDIG
jgi:DNA polymerase-3 subunit epsilon